MNLIDGKSTEKSPLSKSDRMDQITRMNEGELNWPEMGIDCIVNSDKVFLILIHSNHHTILKWSK